MGIKGLLPIVKPALIRKHINKYSNTRIGIDGHAWVHQVIPTIAYEIYNKIDTDRHIKILISKLKTMISYSITPIMVFDGDYLSSKEKTINERTALKKRYMAEVEFYLKHNDEQKARELMKRCVSISKEMLANILKVLRQNNIEYIVSPYEADAQLYFLQKIKYIDHIITEDSDLIPYGANSVLYKFTGTHVEEYNSSRLPKCKDSFFSDNILDISILSGCDYLDSIRGVGLITAYCKLKETGDVMKFINFMAASKKDVPENYFEEFVKAKLTFLHHIVYNPYTGQRQYLNESEVDLEFLGTLEELPFTVNVALSEVLIINRHHKSSKEDSAISTANINRVFDKREITFDSSVEVDENIISPYFK